MTRIESRLVAVEKKKIGRKSIEVDKDPLAFARSIDFEPDAWQRELLTSTSKRIILNCCRQSGKSTIVALAAIHEALTVPNALVLVLSPTLRQSGLLFKHVMRFYNKAGRPVRAVTETTLQLKLANGSWVVALPGSEATVRGFSSVTSLLIDEASRVDDALFYSVLPMLAISGGRIVLLSTPFGYRGFFSDTWHDSNWEKIQITANECPRISDDFLDEQRLRMGEFWFSQEYLCSFESSETGLFNEASIRAMFDNDVEEWDI